MLLTNNRMNDWNGWMFLNINMFRTLGVFVAKIFITI